MTRPVQAVTPIALCGADAIVILPCGPLLGFGELVFSGRSYGPHLALSRGSQGGNLRKMSAMPRFRMDCYAWRTRCMRASVSPADA